MRSSTNGDWPKRVRSQFMARNNVRRKARVLIARGRDATDVAIANTFGVANLVGFRVVSEELAAAAA